MSALVTLKKNKEFGYVYRKGRGVSLKDFTLVYVKSRYGGVRAGFSVSKKVGNSVVRNRARRRLKEAFKTVLPEIHGNYCFIFVARPRISAAVFTDMVEQIRKGLSKAGIV